ncbi:MAG: hypothetical protein L0H53_15120 [Candidatus Nitrosocosmicus sp.]|nr:hypothetical protein [Candidatus Nitrosocosmicus sp.]MDN5867280.1 hypothetical protein [Candidatus Nitrosocosmicus sp.]
MNNSNAYIIIGILATVTLIFPLFDETSVFAQKIIPTPVTNTTINNFNQSSYPVVNSLVNETEVMNQNTTIIPQKNSAQPMVNAPVDPNTRITVVAEELFEIRDNIGEARQALNAGNLFELAEHINNLDNLVTVLLTPLPENVTMLEQSKQTLP